MITNWAGDVYNKLLSLQYDEFRWRLFQKTVALMTADGSEDDKISPESLSDFRIPPPSIVDPSEAVPVSNQVEPDNDDEQIDAENQEGEVVAVGNETHERSDKKDIVEGNDWDRCYDDELVGCEVKALYENGWSTGEIMYFNNNLSKYLVEYPDSSTDLAEVADFDGVEMILL